MIALMAATPERSILCEPYANVVALDSDERLLLALSGPWAGCRCPVRPAACASVTGSGGGDTTRPGKQHPDFRDGPRRAEQIALHFGAAQAVQHLSLLLGLDALCRRRHISRLGDTDDRLHDR